MNYCPRCGSRLEERFVHGRYRPVCPTCGFVFYQDPKVGVGAVIELNGRLVLVRRGMEPKRGQWSLPSGYVEHDESPEEAIVREVREETGLIVEPDNLLGVYSFPSGEGSRGVLILYSAHPTGGELVAGDDAAEVRAFGPDELPDDVAWITHEQALREWRRARSVVFRAATPDDAAAAEAIHRQYGLPTDAAPLRCPSDEEHALYVAVDRSAVIGFASIIYRPWNNTGTLTQIFVIPPYRRWGIATHLLEKVIAAARARQLSRLLAETPADNPALFVYLKAGFRVCGFNDSYYPLNDPRRRTALYLAYELA